LNDYKKLLGLAWPIIVSHSSQVVISLTDAMMVSHLGEAALAATTTGAMNAVNLMILPMGTVFIVSSFASQYHGAGDPASARRYAVYGLLIAAFTFVISIAALPLVDPLLGTLSLDPEVRTLMHHYLLIRIPSAGAVVGIEALAGYYGGIGNTKWPMRVNILAMGLNVAGNWVLISGRYGFPALGVEGSATATLCATTIAFALSLFVFLRESRGNFGNFARSEMWRTLRFGIPAGMNWFLEMLAFTWFINIFIAELGTTALAAMMAVLQINMVAFMPALGAASAGAILVGQSIGKKAHDDVPKIVAMVLLLTCAWQGLAGIIYATIPGLVLSAFGHGEEFLRLGARLLVIAAAWQIFDAVVTSYAESLRAAGDTTFTLVARVLIAWAFFWPGVWIHRHFFGLSETGAITWIVVYIAVLAFVLSWRFRSGAWRRIQMTTGAPADAAHG
jgi:multidrug resistance protein, MATE family